MKNKLVVQLTFVVSLLISTTLSAQEFVRDNMLDRTAKNYRPACELELATILESTLSDCDDSVKRSIEECKTQVRGSLPEVISVSELELLVHRFVFCNMLTLSGMRFDIEAIDRFRLVFEDHQKNGSYLQGSR